MRECKILGYYTGSGNQKTLKKFTDGPFSYLFCYPILEAEINKYLSEGWQISNFSVNDTGGGGGENDGLFIILTR